MLIEEGKQEYLAGSLLEQMYLVLKPKIRAGAGIEARGVAEIGLFAPCFWSEPESEEVTSLGSASVRERFLVPSASSSSSSSLVWIVWAEGINMISIRLSRARPSRNEGVPAAGGLMTGWGRS